MVMRFGNWNIRNLFKAGSLKTVASELAKYNVDVVAVQEVILDEGGSHQEIIIQFSMIMGMLIITWG
jgi:exonuclease III